MAPWTSPVVRSAGHLLHCAFEVAPRVALHVSTGQSLEVFSPLPSWYDPAGASSHARRLPASNFPTSHLEQMPVVEVSPGKQSLHSVSSCAAVKRPGSHVVHVSPSTRLPAGQALQVVLPGFAVRPEAQASHGVVRFCLSEAVSSAHGSHAFWPVWF